MSVCLHDFVFFRFLLGGPFCVPLTLGSVFALLLPPCWGSEGVEDDIFASCFCFCFLFFGPLLPPLAEEWSLCLLRFLFSLPFLRSSFALTLACTPRTNESSASEPCSCSSFWVFRFRPFPNGKRPPLACVSELEFLRLEPLVWRIKCSTGVGFESIVNRPLGSSAGSAEISA